MSFDREAFLEQRGGLDADQVRALATDRSGPNRHRPSLTTADPAIRDFVQQAYRAAMEAALGHFYDAVPVTLEPGTRLRHVQSDWTMQGGAACGDLLVWERFLVLDGPQAGRCIEFSTKNPGHDETAIPDEVQPVPTCSLAAVVR